MATVKSGWPKPGEKGWGEEVRVTAPLTPELKWKQERYYLEQRIARLRGEIRQLQARLQPVQGRLHPDRAGSTRSKPDRRRPPGRNPTIARWEKHEGLPKARP
jgi:hypothetical protein